ncbi:MAG: hypothetical protein ABH865_07865 [Candidatus Omnitrophota bacterium]
MCNLSNMRGVPPQDINKVLNGYRKKLNNKVVDRCWKIKEDKDKAQKLRQEMKNRCADFDVDLRLEMIQDREMMQKEGFKAKGHPDYQIEITEEEVEAVINTHSDLK